MIFICTALSTWISLKSYNELGLLELILNQKLKNHPNGQKHLLLLMKVFFLKLTACLGWHEGSKE